MKKIITISCLILFGVVAVTLLSSCFIRSCQVDKIDALNKQIDYLEEEVIPMKFEIGKNDNSKIVLKAVFYDLNGEKVASRNVKLNGEELHVDFKVIQFSPKSYLFFPYGFYSDTIAAENGEKVFDAYDNDNFPAIYDGIGDLEDKSGKSVNSVTKKKIREALEEKFNLVKEGQSVFLDNSHGTALHDMKGITKFKKGYIYDVVCHPHSGAIEIVRE